MSQKEEPKSAEVAAKKSSPGMFALILPAILAGGAAFGGVKFAAAHAATPAPPSAEHAPSLPPPGPTVALEPFLVVTLDSSRKTHPMKVTLAVEFEASGKESKGEEGKDDPLKGFVPRIRDAALSYLRGVTYEDAMDNSRSEKMRTELLERFRAAGAGGATRVLVTDLVVQ